MTRVAIAFSSKDRVELTRRTIEPLLQPDKFTLLWCDGSNMPEGQDFFTNHAFGNAMKREVRGGSCRYIVYALTTLLALGVDYVGLCENDVLLDPDWFEPTMALFEQGKADGLEVGAVSARNYEDRVLIQRDGYSINHNLGAGMVIFSRQAAEIILQTYRTGWTSENRKIFSILSGIDIGSFWAFKGGEHMLCADWAWDHILAAHGMCSLALTPAKATQLEDIAAMGLKMVAAPMQSRVDQHAYETFRERSARIRAGGLTLPVQAGDRLYHDGAHVIFPHQIAQLGGYYEGDWHFKLLAAGAFRAPSIEDLFVNPDLQPERTRSFEAEAGWAVTPRAYLSLNLFDERITNPISYSALGNTYLNFDHVGSRGLEMTLRAELATLSCQGSLTLQTAEDGHAALFAVPGEDAFPIGFARVKVAVQPLWRFQPGWTLSSNLLVQGPRYYYPFAQPALARLGTTSTLDLFLNHALTDHLELGLRAMNVTNAYNPFIQPYGNPGAGGDPPLPGRQREVDLKVAMRF